MRLLFDLTRIQPIGGSKFHGGGIYGEIIFFKFFEIAPQKMAIFYDPTMYINETIIGICKKNAIPIYEKSSTCSLFDAAKKEGGVIYGAVASEDYIKAEGIKVVCTIHGLRVLEMPTDYYRYSYPVKRSVLQKAILGLKLDWLKVALDKIYFLRKAKNQQRKLLQSSHIIFVTVSEHSKYSMLSFFPELCEKSIKVFYSPSTTNDCENVKKMIEGKYYLIVSGDRWVKNSIRAIIAFDELFSERPRLEGKVVVTGLERLKFMHYSVRNPERFVCLGYVNDDELKALFKNAYLFVYPSLNEGFGYPPLEAMHEGCPVIASSVASIPEICSDAVLYFNPYSISEIKNRILQMENSDVRTKYSQSGKIRQEMVERKQNQDLEGMVAYLLSFVEDCNG